MGEYGLFSKSRLDKIGEILRQDKNLSQDDNEAISSWRSSHIDIMTNMVNTINRKIKKHNIKKDLVARRLKRLVSIKNKLIRFNGMKLSRMQDIAGVRVVCKDMVDVNKLAGIIKQTYAENKKNKFTYNDKNSKNYINEPKSDGYRSIHQLYVYKDKNGQTYNLELQIRTMLQHYWATAVEVLDMKEQSKIKRGEGQEHYKKFFRLCSVLFTHAENTKIDDEFGNLQKEEVIKKIKDINEEYQILKYLSALAVAQKNIEEQTNENNHYFIVRLNFEQSTLRIVGYKKNGYIEAVQDYSSLENQCKNETSKDVVLISLDNINLLKEAYPNYYLDSKSFVTEINNRINS